MRNRAGGGPMRFYNHQHQYYCGDRPAREVGNRDGIVERCPDPSVRTSIEVDVTLRRYRGTSYRQCEAAIRRERGAGYVTGLL